MDISLPQIPIVSEESLHNDPKKGVAKIMAEGRKWFRAAHELECDALKINKGRSCTIDEIIRCLFSISEKRFFSKHPSGERRVAIFALGGYGREEMGLSSDIDILFLYDGGADAYIREITDSILYPLWDNGIDVTGVTRTLADCVSVGGSDLRAQTAMLDARLVAGDELEAQRLLAFLKNQFSNKRARKRFVRAKLDEQAVRLKRFGESLYLLEPNVKEGEGGLRDYHTLLWIAKAAFPLKKGTFLFLKGETSPFSFDLSKEGAAELLQGVSFLWRVRNALHLLDDKNDRLGVSQQGPIARSFGYTDGRFSGAAEQFMQAYYTHASTVHLQCQRAIEQIVEKTLSPSRIANLFRRRKLADGIFQVGKKLSATSGTTTQGPHAILKIFALAHKRGLSLDAKTKELIMTGSGGNELCFDDTAKKLWKEMFEDPAHLNITLGDMHECRMLAHYFPEMEPLIHRIQHDGFHFYTADEHSIHAIRELGSLFTKKGREAFPIPAEAIKKVKRLHVLTLATLFHDIGKGRGGGHAEIGAELGALIAKRLGWPRDDQDTISFLIRTHLLIPTLAYRRDVKDLHLIQRLAEQVETPEILAMLYLLGFTDVRAMGPHIWSDWKGGLLAELYLNTMSHIEGKGEAAARQRTISKKMEGVHQLLGDTISREELGSYFASMPDRYLVGSTPLAIASHFKMTANLKDEAVVTEVHQLPERGLTELAVVTHDAPGLFAKIAGVLSLNGVNIIDAQLYTLPDGTVLDLLWVTDLSQKPIDNAAMWREIGRQLKDAIENMFDVHEMVGRHSKKRLLSRERKPADTQIDIDNDVAVGETVVDVMTMDRQGLLYDISRTFFELGCTIDRAKITTYADRVIDVFYIRDAGGEKITSKERLKQIQEAITNAVS